MSVINEASIEKESDKLSRSKQADLYEELDFTCEYSSNIPGILKKLNISLAFTSYQAGRLMLVRSDGNTLDVNFKSFPRPMGLVATENGLTLGVFTQVINFNRVDSLIDKLKKPLSRIEDDVTAPRIDNKDAGENEEILNEEQELGNTTDKVESDEQRAERIKYQKALREYQEKLHQPVDERVDSCFITRSSHYSGMINLHDIDWGDEGLWVVNSSFSCLCTLDADYSFVPRWKPHFISELVPEDRCHLNGMTLKDGVPAYVTTFSTSNEQGKWRKGEKAQGTLMDVEHNEIIINGLIMPHSPRWHQNKIYYCNSGLGTFNSCDPSSGKSETVAELQGFTRGVDFYGSIAFVGLSKVRQSDVLNSPPLALKYDETFSGIWLINLSNNSEIGYIKFTGNVDQIYDVTVIPNCTFPELLEPSHPRMRNHFCIP